VTAEPVNHQAGRAKCVYGHTYAPDTTRIDARNRRVCLTCERERDKTRRSTRTIIATMRDYSSPQGKEWREEASCVGIPPEMFQPENHDDAKAAIRVCLQCPAILACQREAKAQGTGAVGVWGGKWYREKDRGGAA
jgi:Transcription factor WhiB